MMAFENPMQHGEEIADAFSLADTQVYHALSVDGKDPVTIVTPREQWSYAAGFPLRKSHLDSSALKTHPVLVRIEATTERGQIGIGALGSDEKSFLVEVTQGQGDGETVIELMFGPLAECRYLIVRNVAEGGIASRVVIRSIRVYKAPELPPHLRQTPQATR